MRTHLLPPRTSPRRSVQGFTIIEIMVGLVIGLLTLLAIYQLFAVSEGRRRTVVAVTQAQSAGAMALFSIVGWILNFTVVLSIIGIPMVIIGALGAIILGVYGALKAWNGVPYTYPWQLRILS